MSAKPRPRLELLFFLVQQLPSIYVNNPNAEAEQRGAWEFYLNLLARRAAGEDLDPKTALRMVPAIVFGISGWNDNSWPVIHARVSALPLSPGLKAIFDSIVVDVSPAKTV